MNNSYKPYACNICGNVFKNPGSLASHKSSYHRDQTGREIICPFCLMIQRSQEELRRHFNECSYDMEDSTAIPTEEELKDLQSPGDKYFCEIEECQEGVRTWEDLHYHDYMSHPTCLKCGLPWSNRREYEEHVRKCKARIEDNKKILKRNEVECPICGVVDYNLWQLKRHLESEHSIRKRK